MEIRAGQKYLTDDGVVVRIIGPVDSNLSKFIISVDGIRGTMKITEIQKLKFHKNGNNTSNNP